MLSSYAEMEDAVGNEEWEQINQPDVRKRVQNRLSQRRHSECLEASKFDCTLYSFADYFIQGEKVRQERQPATQELLIPPTFTSSYTMDGAHGPSDYPSPSLSFNGHDDRNLAHRSNQPHEGYDAFNAFNTHSMFPPNQTGSNVMAQNTQPGSVGMRRSTTPHMGRPAMNNLFQTNNIRPLESHASGASIEPAESRNDYWDSQSLSDPQWTIPDFHQNSLSDSNPPASTTDTRPTSNNMHRRQPKPIPRPMSNVSSSHQMNAPPNPRTSDSYSSSVLQRNNKSHVHPGSGSHLENTRNESKSTRDDHDTCSHCRTCRTPNNFDDQKPGRVSPKTPASTPSQDSSQAGSPEHHEILANCSKVLADLARQSEYRDENDSGQRPRSSKRNKSNQQVYCADGSGSSQEDDYGDGHRRRNVVGKVVILCMKNERKIKGK